MADGEQASMLGCGRQCQLFLEGSARLDDEGPRRNNGFMLACGMCPLQGWQLRRFTTESSVREGTGLSELGILILSARFVLFYCILLNFVSLTNPSPLFFVLLLPLH